MGGRCHGGNFGQETPPTSPLFPGNRAPGPFPILIPIIPISPLPDRAASSGNPSALLSSPGTARRAPGRAADPRAEPTEPCPAPGHPPAAILGAAPTACPPPPPPAVLMEPPPSPPPPLPSPLPPLFPRCAPGLSSAAPLRLPGGVACRGVALGRGLGAASARADWGALAARPRPLPARVPHVIRRRRPARWTLEAQDGGGAGGGEGEGSGAAAPPAGPGRHRAAPDARRRRGAALRTAGAALRGRSLRFLPQRLPRPGLRAAAPTGPPGAEPVPGAARPLSSGLPPRRASPVNSRD